MNSSYEFDAKEFVDNLEVASFVVQYDYKSRLGNFLYLNDRGKEFFLKLLNENQIKEGFNVRDIVSDSDLESPLINILNKLLNGEPITIRNQEYLLKTKDNKKIIILANFRAFVKDFKIIIQGCLYEKAKVQENIDTLMLKREIEGFRELFQIFSGIIMIVNEEGRILFVSPNVDDSYLYKPRKEIIGKTFAEIFPEGLTKFFMSMVTDVITSKQIRDIEYHLPIQNKVKWFKATALPIERSEGELQKIITIIWEITDLKIKDK